MNNSSVVVFFKKGMHFLKLNTLSFLLKVSEIKLIAEKTPATVISVTETWLVFLCEGPSKLY